MSQTIDNPFAVSPRRRPSRLLVTSRLLVGAKGLAMVAALFAFLIVAQAQSRRWLLERWVTGLAELPVAQQVERLLQIDALGDIATETVARRLAAEDDTVAAAAYELLREHQNEWTTRDDAAIGRAHKNLIQGIAAVAPELQGQRARWAKELLNQSLLECVDRRVREMDDAYDAANRALAIFTQNNPSSQTLASSSSNPTASLGADAGETSLRPRLVPLPVRLPMQADLSHDQMVAKAPTIDADQSVEVLQAIQTEPRITQVTSSVEPTRAMNDQIRDTVQPVRHLTQSSLETFDTKSVIGLLGSQQAETRDQAVNELVRRGLSNEEIRIANQLASSAVEVRLGLLESIVNRTDVDPRPWLLWLAEDSNREVRMRAISSLATMNDASIKQALRKRLSSEHDPAVIAHLNRAVSMK